MNGSTWSSVGAAVWDACSSTVTAFTEYNGEPVAGGVFSSGSLGRNILRWNGSSWNTWDEGVGPSGGSRASVLALTVADDELWVGGIFRSVGDDRPSTCIARWKCIDGAPCPADFNQDGGVDGADVEAFFAAWEDDNAAADVNYDGGVDGADVETFFAAWENGGC